MLGIIEDLGDELANMVPDLPGANSPYAILFHCGGVVNFWVSTLIAERHVERDRDAEFRAQGTVTEIRQLVDDLKRQLREDLAHLHGEQPISQAPPTMRKPAPGLQQGWTQGAALIHTYEELAQHHGQMELTRDILKQGRNAL